MEHKDFICRSLCLSARFRGSLTFWPWEKELILTSSTSYKSVIYEASHGGVWPFTPF